MALKNAFLLLLTSTLLFFISDRPSITTFNPDYLVATWSLLCHFCGTIWGLLYGDYLQMTWRLLGFYCGTTAALLGDYITLTDDLMETTKGLLENYSGAPWTLLGHC